MIGELRHASRLVSACIHHVFCHVLYPVNDQHPIRGGGVILQVASCYINRSLAAALMSHLARSIRLVTDLNLLEEKRNFSFHVGLDNNQHTIFLAVKAL